MAPFAIRLPRVGPGRARRGRRPTARPPPIAARALRVGAAAARDGMRAAWPRAPSGVTHTRPAPADPTRPNVRETYTFYNPVQHPAFDREGGRVIFIEGTMATT